MRFDRIARNKYKLMAPYVVIFALIGTVGYQLIDLSSAAPLPQDKITLTVDKTQYAPNDIVKFTLTNLTDSSIFVANNCPDVPLQVYRQESQGWQQLHATVNASKCENEPRSYEVTPRAKVSATYIYWPSLFSTPGHYRLVAPIDHFDTAPSVEFDVAAPESQ